MPGEFIKWEWLDQHTIWLNVTQIRVTIQVDTSGDHDHGRGRGDLFDFSGQSHAVHLRHVHVGNHQIVTAISKQFQADCRTIGRLNLIPECFQKGRQGFARERIVVNVEKSPFFAADPNL